MERLLKFKKNRVWGRPELNRFIKLAAPVFLILILVIGVNWLNQRHLEQVQNDLDRLYIERLVSQDYLYRLNHQLNLKRYQIAMGGQYPIAVGEQKSIEQLLRDVQSLKLSLKETLYFNDLKKNYSKLVALERSRSENTIESRAHTLTEINIILDKMLLNIDDLVSSKLLDNRKLLEINKATLTTKKTLLNTEIGFLVVFAIIFQLIFYYSSFKLN